MIPTIHYHYDFMKIHLLRQQLLHQQLLRRYSTATRHRALLNLLRIYRLRQNLLTHHRFVPQTAVLVLHPRQLHFPDLNVGLVVEAFEAASGRSPGTRVRARQRDDLSRSSHRLLPLVLGRVGQLLCCPRNYQLRRQRADDGAQVNSAALVHLSLSRETICSEQSCQRSQTDRADGAHWRLVIACCGTN